jgi:hypothetical protein
MSSGGTNTAVDLIQQFKSLLHPNTTALYPELDFGKRSVGGKSVLMLRKL